LPDSVKLLGAAGLEVLADPGWIQHHAGPARPRPPPWAAREVMVADGVATPEEVERWRQAFDHMDAAAVRPTVRRIRPHTELTGG
jgi:hypothetical protein